MDESAERSKAVADCSDGENRGRTGKTWLYPAAPLVLPGGPRTALRMSCAWEYDGGREPQR